MGDYLDFYLLHLLDANSPCRILDLTPVLNQSQSFLMNCQKTHFDRKTVFNRVQKFAQNGWVQLTSYPADHCVRNVLWGELTRKGERMLASLDRMFAKLILPEVADLESPSAILPPVNAHWYEIDVQERVTMEANGKTLLGEELLMDRTVDPPIKPQELERVVTRLITKILSRLDIKVIDRQDESSSYVSEVSLVHSSHS